MRRTITVSATTETTFTVDPTEFEGMSREQILRHLALMAEGHMYGQSVVICEEDLELAAYQVRADLLDG